MATNSPSSLGGGNSVTPPKSAAKKKQSPTGTICCHLLYVIE